MEVEARDSTSPSEPTSVPESVPESGDFLLHKQQPFTMMCVLVCKTEQPQS